MASLLAIVPAYKRPEQLQRCLAALAASITPVEPFVVNNDQINLGFTKACNVGLKQSLARGHEFALLLNQDCYVQPYAIEKVLAFMAAHPRCAIAGVKQLSAEDPDHIIHGGCTDAHPGGKHLMGRVSAGDCAVSTPMSWVNGACWLVRVEALREVGLMDEGYFLIASDSDFCFTVRQRGWDVWYCADSVVLHEGGGISSSPNDLATMARLQEDQRRFRDKWVGTIGWELLRQSPPSRALLPDEIAGALSRMNAHYGRNELAQAEIVARQLLDWSPGHPDGLYTLGRVYTRNGLASLGAEQLARLIELLPESAVAHVALADALVTGGFAGQAVTHYRKGGQLGIRSADLHNNLGVALLKDGQRQEAIASWRAALSLDPENPVAKKNLADVGA